jgi:apolipoprotein N-acyltransferase
VTVRGILPTRRVALLAAATAALLFVAYPPASLVLPSFLCLVPFLWWLEEGVGFHVVGAGEARSSQHPAPSAQHRTFLSGFWFGVIVNGTVLYWMVVALWHFTPLSFLGYAAALGLVLGPLWGALAVAVVRVRRRTAIPLWVAFPLLWTALEWLIAHLSDLRFPWLGLGTSLTRVPVLVQWADLAGARGVTLWLAWANVMVVLTLRRRAWRPAVLLAVSLAAAAGYGAWRQRTLAMRPALTVAVVQPNVDYELKRRNRNNDSLVTALLAMSREARRDSSVQLVVWPEAVVPDYFYRRPDWERRIGEEARALRTPLLVGGLDVVFDARGDYEYYNAAFVFDTSGSGRNVPVYHKRFLVPIVERVPFVNPRWFGGLDYFGGYGIGRVAPVYRVDGADFGVLICYESAFEDLSRGYRRAGADFLVNITNDSWYGRTAAPYQHAAHLVMRAIETRMGIARAASTGISQFVDPLGRAHESTGLYVLDIRTRPVLTTDGRTLYVRLGDWVGLVALIGAAACLVAAWRRSAKGDTA